MKSKFIKNCSGAFFIMLAAMSAGCANQTAPPPAAVEVNVMEVIQRDTPVTYEFVGQVEAKNEVQIRAKISGNITNKMVAGGVAVRAGQPLFQIDRRQYEADVLAAQAQLAQAEAALSNSRLDVARYTQLADLEAIAKQVLDNALTVERQNAAQVNAYKARLKQAQDTLDDTLIVSPINGRIDVNTLSVGTFVQAGQTLLATVSSIDPVLVRFSMSENEYLRFVSMGRSQSNELNNEIRLILGDGSEYPIAGNVEQVDRGMAQDTGTIAFKAAFANPQHILVSGMFARVLTQGEIRVGALLIQQRAVQELLGKTFITVVGKDDKAEQRQVVMGPRIGDLWIVESGLAPGEKVIVEGFLKTPPGTPLKVMMIDQSNL